MCVCLDYMQCIYLVACFFCVVHHQTICHTIAQLSPQRELLPNYQLIHHVRFATPKKVTLEFKKAEITKS